MRVLVITNYFPPNVVGGAEVAAYSTCIGLRQRGVSVSVLMVNARMPETEDRHYQLDGLPVHCTLHRPYPVKSPWLQTFDPRVYRDVMAELKRLRPDLVHIHNVSGATLAPFAACRRFNVPTVLTLHDHWLLCPNNMLYRGDGTLCDPARVPAGCTHCFRRYDYWGAIPQRRQVFARLVEHVRLFISPSEKLVDLHVAGGYDRARFRVVRNGILPDRFQPPSDARAQEVASACSSFPTLLFAGAVVETKGVQILIEALPLLSKYVDRLHLNVAGSGEERFLAALRGFEPRAVTLLGRVNFQEMQALYAAADLTVVPSTWYDNSPMVIYESLLAGTPAIGSQIGGIPELIAEGQTGHTFPPGDALALAETVIRHFALSAYERRAMRQRCREYACAHLTLDRHIDRLQPVYEEALAA